MKQLKCPSGFRELTDQEMKTIAIGIEEAKGLNRYALMSRMSDLGGGAYMDRLEMNELRENIMKKLVCIEKE